MQPHRQQPTRLPCPWDSPGKNTGVGCHFLLQCMKLKSESEVLSRVRLLATPWTAAYQAPPFMGFSRQEYWSGVPLPSPTISHSLLKFLSIESVIVSNYLILCLPLLLLPSVFPSIRIFSNEIVPPIIWPKYWSFKSSISPSNENSVLISLRIN